MEKSFFEIRQFCGQNRVQSRKTFLWSDVKTEFLMRERERENMIKSAHIFSSRKCVPRKTNNGNRKGRTDRERRKGLAERKSYIKKERNK